MNGTIAELASLRGRRIVIGVTGGIAAYKAPLVVRRLVTAGATVDVILTRGATHFVGAAIFAGLTGRKVRGEVWDDIEEETHVALGRNADVVAVYPATAHTLARAAMGLADDLLTTTLLAATAPVVMAPAMHTEMWEHPATQANADLLEQRGVVLVGPAQGPLMGGDTGTGRAVEPDTFVAAVVAALHSEQRQPIPTPAPTTSQTIHPVGLISVPTPPRVDADLAGRHVVVTAGGTQEPLDPVRHFGNRSTGRMGFAIAAAAARRGATVDLIAAPTQLATPEGVVRVDVTTAVDMHAAVFERVDKADVVVMAAAVTDFRPSTVATTKLKKQEGAPVVEFVRNPDILAELGHRRADEGSGPVVLVGFAAETDDVEANAMAKLGGKKVDLLVVNDVTAPGVGFGHDTNEVTILGDDGSRVDIPRTTKDAVAGQLLDLVAKRLIVT